MNQPAALHDTPSSQPTRAAAGTAAAPDDGGQPAPLPPCGAPDEVAVYRTVGGVTLQAHLFRPADVGCGTAVAFFFGGGWANGKPEQFYPHAAAAAARGALGIVFDYRVKNRHGTTPFESVADAKAAVRWVRGNAARLGVRPDRIVAAGGSAGGHLAAACALLPAEEAGANLSVSCVPDALVLFNPVPDTTDERFARSAIGPRCRELSPVHHVAASAPPAILFHGTEDATVVFADAERFCAALRAAGNRCELVAYPGRGHGFFNVGRTPDVSSEVWERSVRFLASVGVWPSARAPALPAARMTPRARWLAALRCQPVDRLPFWPKLGGAYAAARTGRFAGMTADQLHQWVGSDPHVGVGCGVVDTHRACRYESTRTGDELIERFVIPGGTLVRRQRYDAASQSWHPLVLPVETREQLELMTRWYADSVPECSETELEQARARCRDLGETASTQCGVGESALMTFVEHLAGPITAQYLLADHPDEVGALFAAMHRNLLRRMELAAAQAPADALYLIENTSTTLISPDQYRRYCLPHLREYAALARAHDRILVLHMCGHIKAILPDLATVGAAAFEAFTSPTVGNTTLANGRRHCPDVCLIGGTNASLWTRPAGEIIATLKRHLDELPHRRGLVVTSAGVMPPVAEPETIRAVRDFVANYEG